MLCMSFARGDFPLPRSRQWPTRRSPGQTSRCLVSVPKPLTGSDPSDKRNLRGDLVATIAGCQAQSEGSITRSDVRRDLGVPTELPTVKWHRRGCRTSARRTANRPSPALTSTVGPTKISKKADWVAPLATLHAGGHCWLLKDHSNGE